MRMGVRRVPIHIVNLTQTADIQKMLQNAKHDKKYGFRTYQLDAQDDDWKVKIIARADEVKKLIANEQKR